MTISAATAVGPSQASQSSNIGIEDFLKILSAQLNNQDPLKPVDNTEFIAQIAQFASLGQRRELNGKIDSLLSSQASTQSVGLLGKTIDATFGGQLLTGRVTALSLTSLTSLRLQAPRIADTLLAGLLRATAVNKCETVYVSTRQTVSAAGVNAISELIERNASNASRRRPQALVKVELCCTLSRTSAAGARLYTARDDLARLCRKFKLITNTPTPT